MLKHAWLIPMLALTAVPGLSGADGGTAGTEDAATQTLRFVQDDAQDYMVSKIYRLKYIQANDITPFVMGIVMRYNMNSSVGPYELLSQVINKVFDKGDPLPVGKGEAQEIKAFTGFGFTMTVNNVSVNLAETRFDVTLSNTSLIGFQSNGAPRITSGGVVQQTVSLPHGKDTFVIGGLTKQTEVESRTGVPWLMDIPVLGYLFSSVSNSVKNTELVVMAQCEWDSLADKPGLRNTTKAETRGSPSAIRPVMPAQNIPAGVPRPELGGEAEP